MERYYELFSKLNDIFKYIIAIFVVFLVADSLIFTFIPLTFFKVLGIGLLTIYLLGFVSYKIIDRYCNYIFLTDSPKDYLWTFKDFLDCYNGKIDENYFSTCDNYDFFEDAMDKFSELFDDESHDHFGKVCQHFKSLYKNADNEKFVYDEKNYHDNDKKQMIEEHAYHFLIMKYNQLSNYVKLHDNHNLWTAIFNNINGKSKQLEEPKAFTKNIQNMLKLMEN